jgi:hypothetical protein
LCLILLPCYLSLGQRFFDRRALEYGVDGCVELTHFLATTGYHNEVFSGIAHYFNDFFVKLVPIAVLFCY